MEANEIEDGKVLMIGDLVVGCIETDIVGEATYKILCKVTDINHYGDIICEALKPFPDELDWQDGDDFSWIEPMPLTAEILEKNEFIFMTGLWYLETKERKPIQIVFKDNNVITLSINATPVPIGLKYVHQLQHALRLYGIDKEIIL